MLSLEKTSNRFLGKCIEKYLETYLEDFHGFIFSFVIGIINFFVNLLKHCMYSLEPIESLKGHELYSGTPDIFLNTVCFAKLTWKITTTRK